MDERTQGALLLAVGGVALRLGLTTDALTYVKAGLRPLLVATGVVLGVLGVAAVVRAFRAGAPTAPDGPPEAQAHDLHGHAADDGHGHAGHGPGVAWLLVLPLLAVLLVAPPPLGSFAAGRQTANALRPTQSSYPPLPEPVDGAVELRVSEYVFRALFDEDESLRGERIRLTGFVTPAEDGDGYLLNRFVLNCCAADGQVVNVEVVGDPQARAKDAWVTVEGFWEPRPGVKPGEAIGGDPPLLRAERVQEIPQPEQPYEY